MKDHQTTSPQTQQKRQAKANSTSTTNTYLVAGEVGANFTLGSKLNISVPNGPTKTFLIEFISAYIQFNSNFEQDPAFFLDFKIGGDSGEHAFSADRVPTTTPNMQGYQPFYVLSRQVKIAVNGGTDVTFYAEHVPTVGATADVHISGRFV
ncbi:MAG TPA: hypothetical protein VKB38_02060 [Terracidiphilus sp.]|nr:hypothetical protein [Terracidiphilus sp.]